MSPTVAAYAQSAGIISADWTAIGTLALAIATVLGLAVTIWLTVGDRHRADSRLEAEIQRERDRAEAERLKEQEAEAYLVEVAFAITDQGHPDDERGDLDKRIAVIAINHGHYTITQVEARYCVGIGGDPSIQPFGGPKQLVSTGNMPLHLFPGWRPGPAGNRPPPWVAPWDAGLRIESDIMSDANARNAYPIVRWTDWRGTQWEHKRGVVRQVTHDTPWTP